MISRWIVAALLGAWSASPHAQIADYPTLDRVLFVEECVRNHPNRSRQEMVYKCACAMDALGEQIPYAQFTEFATASNAASIAGERGNVARGDEALTDARRYRRALASAYASCLISP